MWHVYTHTHTHTHTHIRSNLSGDYVVRTYIQLFGQFRVGKVMLDNDFQITCRTKLIRFADTEYYLFFEYRTKEFVIRLWLSALAMAVKYTIVFV